MRQEQYGVREFTHQSTVGTASPYPMKFWAWGCASSKGEAKSWHSAIGQQWGSLVSVHEGCPSSSWQAYVQYLSGSRTCYQRTLWLLALPLVWPICFFNLHQRCRYSGMPFAWILFYAAGSRNGLEGGDTWDGYAKS